MHCYPRVESRKRKRAKAFRVLFQTGGSFESVRGELFQDYRQIIYLEEGEGPLKVLKVSSFKTRDSRSCDSPLRILFVWKSK